MKQPMLGDLGVDKMRVEPQRSEVLELPLVAHPGRCFVALQLGTPVDQCRCLDAIALMARKAGS